jgi:hypothetical protein
VVKVNPNKFYGVCACVGVPSPSASETDSEDAMFGAVSSFCASGSFITLTVRCECPVKILYLVFG